MLTYRELRDFLNTLSDSELELNVTAYSGDIDETLSVMGIGRNTDDDMGEALDTLDENHPLLLLA